MRYCTFLLFLLLLGSVSNAAKPNIIVIMADDFGYECVTANGGQSYQTPNIDRLAANGIRFEQCHVQPLCTPTRVQLMTGRFNVRNYVNFGTLLRTETTFAHLLKEAGYSTAVCGKWQLGREKDSPQHFGFDESCLWQQTRRPPRYANPVMKAGRVNRDLISSVDILPTICKAAGVGVPANTDGVSFEKQLRGENGTPREWLYCWYSPRQQADLTVKEYSQNQQYKLYSTGKFFDLASDPFRATPSRSRLSFPRGHEGRL